MGVVPFDSHTPFDRRASVAFALRQQLSATPLGTHLDLCGCPVVVIHARDALEGFAPIARLRRGALDPAGSHDRAGVDAVKCLQYQQGVAEAMAAWWQLAGSAEAPPPMSEDQKVTPASR